MQGISARMLIDDPRDTGRMSKPEDEWIVDFEMVLFVNALSIKAQLEKSL